MKLNEKGYFYTKKKRIEYFLVVLKIDMKLNEKEYFYAIKAQVRCYH